MPTTIPKRIGWSLVLIGVVALAVNAYLSQRSERAGKEAERARVHDRVRAEVAESVEHHGAVTDWQQRLSKGERYRLSPVLTIELEELWQREGPILFVGSIKDISSDGPDYYSVIVERNLYDLDYMFSTELRLALSAPRSVIDNLLAQHPALRSAELFNNGVAVVAKIEEIASDDELTENSERVEVRTGKGKLLDIVFTGDVYL